MRSISQRLLSILGLLFLVTVTRSQSSQKQPGSAQKVIIIMLDGFGEDYYRMSDMPTLNYMEKHGLFNLVRSLMPSITNVNATSIWSLYSFITLPLRFPEELLQWINSNDMHWNPEPKARRGLGLAIVNKILQLHEYGIKASNSNGVVRVEIILRAYRG